MNDYYNFVSELIEQYIIKLKERGATNEKIIQKIKIYLGKSLKTDETVRKAYQNKLKELKIAE